MKSWIKWLLVAVALLALGGAIWRAVAKRESQQGQATAALTAMKTPPNYQLEARDVHTVELAAIEQSVAVTGTVKAVRSAVVKAKVAGEIQGLTLREGDAVREGQVIARIDSADAQARVRQAEQQAEAALAQAAIARRQRDNNQALVAQGFISPTALDSSQANLDAALANHQAGLAALDIARKALADTQVRAPIGGQVASRLAQDGERVAIDGRILEIIDPAAMELEVALAPADALSVRMGQSASWSVEGVAQPGEARVARISPSAQAGSRSVLVYLSLPRTAGLRQGLFAQGRIRQPAVQALAVPLAAVRTDKPEPYVLVVREGAVQPVALRAQGEGVAGGEAVAIVAPDGAIRAGDVLLRASAGAMAAGTRVQLPAR